MSLSLIIWIVAVLPQSSLGAKSVVRKFGVTSVGPILPFVACAKDPMKKYYPIYNYLSGVLLGDFEL